MERQLPMAGTDPQPNNQEPDPAQVDYQEGLRHLQHGNLSQAANAFHNARIGFEEAGNEEGLANAYFRLGDVCLETQEYAKALDYYEQSATIIKKHDDLMSMLAIRKRRIACFKGLQRYQDAIAAYLELLDTYEALHNPASTVETLIGMGETFELMGERHKAAEAFRTAASIHRRYKHEKAARELDERAAKAAAAGKTHKG